MRRKRTLRGSFSWHINSKENHEMLLQIFIRGKILKSLTYIYFYINVRYSKLIIFILTITNIQLR